MTKIKILFISFFFRTVQPGTVLFDPRKLNEEQTLFLKDKLEIVSSTPDRDGCRKFLLNARLDGRYGKIKSRSDISRLFGKEDRDYNASKLLYCLHMGVVWYEGMVVECSHLCGWKSHI